MLLRNAVFAPFWQTHRRAVLLTGTAGFVNSLLTLLLPLSLGRFYEQLLGGTSGRGQVLHLLGLGDLTGEGWTEFFGFFAALIALRGLTEYAERRLTSCLGEAFVGQVRQRVFARQLAVSPATHHRKAPGKYLLRYGSDFGSLRRYLTRGGVGFAKDVLFLLLTLAVLLSLSPGLTLLLVGSLLPFLFLFRWVNRRLETRAARRRDLRSAYLNHVATRLNAFETIKIFNRETPETEQFARRSEALSAASVGVLAGRSVLAGLLPVAAYAMVLAVMLGVHGWRPDGLSRGDGGVIIAFVLLALSLRPVLRRMLRVGAVWRAGRVSLQKVTQFLDQPAESEPDRPALAVTGGEIAFERVSFAYQPGKPVLENLSFRVGAGTIAQMTGGPGTGKTTVLRLVLGLYAPDRGTIRIDGQNLADLAPASVRQHVTLASADVPLLGRTVFEAVSYSRKPEKRPRAERLLAELSNVAGLPHPPRLDDSIGEQGQALSAGQRSVLRLVRALLTRKPILLLDEPFGGLTGEAVGHLLDWLDHRVRARRLTVLLVSSRPLPVDFPVIALPAEGSTTPPCTRTLITTP